MTHSLISWEELQRKKTLMTYYINSADFMECMQVVRERFPGAEIRQISDTEWQLWDGLDALSGIHNSHYACWKEARDGTGK